MEKSLDQSINLKKLIDIPRSILKDLKGMAIDADKNLKSYIQDLLIEEVRKFREKKL